MSTFKSIKNINNAGTPIYRPRLKKSHLGWVIVGLLTIQTVSVPVSSVYADSLIDNENIPSVLDSGTLPQLDDNGIIDDNILVDYIDDKTEENNDNKQYTDELQVSKKREESKDVDTVNKQDKSKHVEKNAVVDNTLVDSKAKDSKSKETVGQKENIGKKSLSIIKSENKLPDNILNKLNTYDDNAFLGYSGFRDAQNDLSIWNKGADSNPQRNIGTYGSAGLENYILASDPWADKIEQSDIDNGKTQKVKAKGIWGYDTDSGVKWYLTESGELHLSSGVGFNTFERISVWDKYKASIVKIVIDENATVELPSDSSYLFAGLNKLESIENSNNFNTSQVENMAEMFYATTSLIDLDLSTWDTTNVTNMSFMFYQTHGLKTLNISTWNTSNVTDMSWMFYEARSLTTMDLSTWNIGKVTNISYMFGDMQALTDLNIATWDTTNVTDMSWVFFNATSLPTIDLSNWKTSKVTNMSHMFHSASLLPTVDVSKWDTSKVNNMSYMFSDTTSLTTLDVSKWNISSLTNASYMFNNAIHLSTLDVSNWNTSKLTNASYMFNSTKLLKNLDVSKWDTSRINNASYMFREMSSLISLDVSKWNISKVTNASYMFNSMSSLTTLDVSNWNTNSITKAESMFNAMSSLTELDLSNWDTSNISNMKDMFDNTDSLLKIKFGQNFKINTRNNFRPTLSQKSSGKWREMGTSTDESEPNGDYIDKNETTKIILTNDYIKTPGTYVRYAVPISISSFWIPSENADTKKNTGTYGSDGLENYVLKENPWANTSSNNEPDDLLKVDAKGIYGTAKWYLGLDGTLHIYEGVFPNREAPQGSDNLPGIWDRKLYSARIKKIVFDAHVKAAVDSSRLFSGLSFVTSMEKMNNLDVSYVSKLYGMFGEMDRLQTIKGLDVWNVSNATDADFMFDKDYALTYLNTSNWRFNNLESARLMFSETTALKTLDTSTWGLGKLKYANYMFNKSGIEKINVTRWNVNSVIQANYMFANAVYLTELDTSKWKLENIVFMSSTFENTPKLTTLETSSWNPLKLKKINKAFSRTGVKELDMGNWTVPNMQDMENAFSKSPNLEFVSFANWDTSNIEDMSDMFLETPKLRKVVFSDTFSVPDSKFYWANMYVPSYDYSWREIGSGTEEKPNGEALGVAANTSFTLGFKPKKGTYILSLYNKPIKFKTVDESDSPAPKELFWVINTTTGEKRKVYTKENGEISVVLVTNQEYKVVQGQSSSKGSFTDFTFNTGDTDNVTIKYATEYKPDLPITGSNLQYLLLTSLISILGMLGMQSIRKNKKDLQ